MSDTFEQQIRGMLLSQGWAAAETARLGELTAGQWRAVARRVGRQLGRPIRTITDGGTVAAALVDWPASEDERQRYTARRNRMHIDGFWTPDRTQLPPPVPDLLEGLGSDLISELWVGIERDLRQQGYAYVTGADLTIEPGQWREVARRAARKMRRGVQTYLLEGGGAEAVLTHWPSSPDEESRHWAAMQAYLDAHGTLPTLTQSKTGLRRLKS